MSDLHCPINYEGMFPNHECKENKKPKAFKTFSRSEHPGDHDGKVHKATRAALRFVSEKISGYHTEHYFLDLEKVVFEVKRDNQGFVDVSARVPVLDVPPVEEFRFETTADRPYGLEPLDVEFVKMMRIPLPSANSLLTRARAHFKGEAHIEALNAKKDGFVYEIVNFQSNMTSEYARTKFIARKRIDPERVGKGYCFEAGIIR